MPQYYWEQNPHDKWFDKEDEIHESRLPIYKARNIWTPGNWPSFSGPDFERVRVFVSNLYYPPPSLGVGV